ncbi:MAG TPA: hypothetical protein VKA15_09110 [Isosphaeraceae bacterium]|nr:hypothetical protein [Isosphaeraceae bacterium]
MAKRPRFSRWRRLPGVFRSGEHRPPDKGSELDRIILYVPAAVLDLAERLAEKEGAATVQEYCAQLLIRAVEDARVRHKVSDFEARRGPLEGLKEIASDPDYLTEWRARQEERRGASNTMETEDGKPDSTDEASPLFIEGPGDSPVEDDRADQQTEPEAGSALRVRIEMVDRSATTVALKPTVLLASNQSALEILARHVGWVADDWGFLPCLRRGEAVPPIRVSELTRALGELEDELRGAELLDRRTAHALHRLALESQVLLTDAWPGVFDDNAVAAIRTIQEAVERILSGADIRYYPAPAEPGSERPH